MEEFLTAYLEFVWSYGNYVMWATVVYLGFLLRFMFKLLLPISQKYYKILDFIKFVYPIYIVLVFTRNAVAVLFAAVLSHYGLKNKVVHLLSYCVCVPFLCLPMWHSLFIFDIPALIFLLCSMFVAFRGFIFVFKHKEEEIPEWTFLLFLKSSKTRTVSMLCGPS